MVRSEVWEVIANLKWVAFGTPMFSRRLDAGYAVGKKDEKSVNNYWLCHECYHAPVHHPEKLWLKPAAPTPPILNAKTLHQ